jgi:hypothetical protein
MPQITSIISTFYFLYLFIPLYPLVSFQKMSLFRQTDLPFLLSLNLNYILPIFTHNPSILSPFSMGGHHGNNGQARQYPAHGPLSVTQALEIARDSEEGAQDPTVVTVLEAAMAAIWSKIETQRDSYILTRDEFAVLNYFQRRFEGNEIATAAKKRYWDNLSISNAD